MPAYTAEQFAQRIFDFGLVDARQIDQIWGELGSRDASLEELKRTLLRREILTRYQVERVERGERSGFFYGAYRVLYFVGSGTFARVYRAEHRETGRIVAAKVLRTRYREDAVTRERFVREGEMGAKLRHPNIAPIYEVYPDTRTPFLVMEFVEGQSLREFVKVRGRVGALQSLQLLAGVAAGLQHAAEKGIQHRDLKMSNVLISSLGRAKLVDFGLASISNVSDDAINDCPNPRTIDYAGLERATGVKKDDPRSDLYFAGCLLYHMLAGEAPLFETRDRLQRLSTKRFREVPNIAELVEGLPQPALVVLNRAMELDPRKRYQEPSEMLADLNNAIRRIEAGDFDSAMAPPPSKVELEGSQWTLLVVASNTALQNMLRDSLKKYGYRVLVMSSAQRALERMRDDPNAADCAIFTTHELNESAVRGFNSLVDDPVLNDMPAILLLDKKQHQLRDDAKLDEKRVAVSMPIRLKEIRALLLKILSSADTAY